MIPEQDSDSPAQVPQAADKREKRLVERVREAIRARHYSRRMEHAYWYWIRQFIFFHGKRHPAEMGAAEVTAFLSWLAVERDVAAATQGQALSALLFLYQQVLGLKLPWLAELVRAQRPVRLPTVLSEAQVRRLLDALEGGARLMAGLLYGSGLRQIECLTLHVKDVDFVVGSRIPASFHRPEKKAAGGRRPGEEIALGRAKVAAEEVEDVGFPHAHALGREQRVPGRSLRRPGGA